MGPAIHLNFGIHETSTDLNYSTFTMSDEQVYQEILEFAYDLVEKVRVEIANNQLIILGIEAHPGRLRQALDLPRFRHEEECRRREYSDQVPELTPARNRD